MNKRSIIFCLLTALILIGSYPIIFTANVYQTNDVKSDQKPIQTNDCTLSDCLKSFKNYDMNKVIKILGYDPHITLYLPKNETTCSNESRVTIYCHGYGENQNSIPYLQDLGILPGIVIGFNFEEVTKNGPAWSKTSLGQGKDIAVLCMVLKIAHECGFTIIDTTGFSRGAATIINTLARLERYSSYRTYFTKLNISTTNATSLSSSCLKGIITLLCPMIDARIVTAAKSFGPFMHWAIALSGGSYNPKQDQAINGAAIVGNLNPKMLVIIQKNDPIVRNDKDLLFCNHIKGPYTHIIAGEKPGSHYVDETMGYAIQAMRKKYDAPYDYDYVASLLIGEQLLKQTLLI